MKTETIIVLFVLGIGIYSIYGDLEIKQIVERSKPFYSLVVPSIYGNNIVWSEGTNICIYDISKDREKKISSKYSHNPAIYGNKIVWVEEVALGNNIIYLYDLSKEEKKKIINDSRPQGSPKIYGDKIVWIDQRNKYSTRTSKYPTEDIYIYDLSTGEEKRITQEDCSYENGMAVYHSHDYVNVAIYGDKIVWEELIYKESEYRVIRDYDIVLYDLSTGEEKRITDDLIPQHNPKVYENKVIWEEIVQKSDSKGYNARICLYDLSTNQKSIIATDVCNNNTVYGLSAIYGDKIVWNGVKNGISSIFLYDISKGEEEVIAYGYSGFPAICENAIVWAYNEEDYFEMYICFIGETLPNSESPSTFTESHEDKPHRPHSLYLGIFGGIILFLVITIPLLSLSKRKSEKMREIKKETQKEDLITLLSEKYLDGKITKEQYLKFKKKIEEI